MVIFHSYVSLPEGKWHFTKPLGLVGRVSGDIFLELSFSIWKAGRQCLSINGDTQVTWIQLISWKILFKMDDFYQGVPPMDWKPPSLAKINAKIRWISRGFLPMDWHGLAYSKISRNHHEPSGTPFFSMGKSMVKPAKKNNHSIPKLGWWFLIPVKIMLCWLEQVIYIYSNPNPLR